MLLIFINDPLVTRSAALLYLQITENNHSNIEEHFGWHPRQPRFICWVVTQKPGHLWRQQQKQKTTTATLSNANGVVLSVFTFGFHSKLVYNLADKYMRHERRKNVSVSAWTQKKPDINVQMLEWHMYKSQHRFYQSWWRKLFVRRW